MTVEKPKKRRRPKTNRNLYFTEIHEQAVRDYVLSNDIDERNKIYSKILQPVFREIIDKIVCTFKFTNLPNIGVEKDVCEVWLQQNIDKFKPEKGLKAFSYFSVIVKNYFFALGKDQKKSLSREIEKDEVSFLLEKKYITSDNVYEQSREKKEFLDDFWQELLFWERQIPLTDNDRKVLISIKGLFADGSWYDLLEESFHELDKYITDQRELDKMRRKFSQNRFLKVKIYELIEEDTKLSRKQIGQSVKKFKEFYLTFKQESDNYLL